MLREANFAANDAARLDATTAFSLATGIKVPGTEDARAAWFSLPIETRDRIGTLAVDHILQMFLAGDDTCAPGRQPLRGDWKAESEADTRAGNASTELWHLVERELPDLFGPDFETGPVWAKGADR